LRFIIFYSFIEKKPCFEEVFNIVRKNTNLIPYEPNKRITYKSNIYEIMNWNNIKYEEFLINLIDNIAILIYLLNELLPNCKKENLINCKNLMCNDPCAKVHPLQIDFNSDDYLYYNIPRPDIIIGGSNSNKKYKYKITNKKTKN
jgi:hypothetical protein